MSVHPPPGDYSQPVAPRVNFAGGGLREPQDDKIRYDLLMPIGVPLWRQFLTRCALHMGQSLKKYPERNWEQFADLEAYDRCKASAFRHFMAWMAEETDEDHAAAVFFNLMAAEHVKSKIDNDLEVNDG